MMIPAIYITLKLTLAKPLPINGEATEAATAPNVKIKVYDAKLKWNVLTSGWTNNGWMFCAIP